MGFGEWMARVLKGEGQGQGKSPTDEEVAKAKAGAEAINKALPAALSGRAAVLKKREQMRQMDKMLEER